MTESPFVFEIVDLKAPRLGLIALQSDETIEMDMRRLLPAEAEVLVTRVRSDPEVTSATLATMEAHLATAASLFPAGVTFDAVGYGCTSGTAEIGVEAIAQKVREAASAKAVTQPLSSVIAACRHLGLRRLALVSPYVAEVSRRLQNVLAVAGIETPVFGSFEVATEATVVRISPASIEAAAHDVMRDAQVDGLFLSCTNLRTLEVIEALEERLGAPVLSSNQVLAWHMMHLAGITPPPDAPGRLFRG